MWLGSDLIGVVLPSETPFVKPNKWYQSRWLIPAQTKGLTLEGEIVRNPSVSLSPTLTRIEKVEHESGVNVLCGWAQIPLCKI